jgi:hypothetical protein
VLQLRGLIGFYLFVELVIGLRDVLVLVTRIHVVSIGLLLLSLKNLQILRTVCFVRLKVLLTNRRISIVRRVGNWLNQALLIIHLLFTLGDMNCRIRFVLPNIFYWFFVRTLLLTDMNCRIRFVLPNIFYWFFVRTLLLTDMNCRIRLVLPNIFYWFFVRTLLLTDMNCRIRLVLPNIFYWFFVRTLLLADMNCRIHLVLPNIFYWFFVKTLLLTDMNCRIPFVLPNIFYWFFVRTLLLAASFLLNARLLPLFHCLLLRISKMLFSFILIRVYFLILG